VAAPEDPAYEALVDAWLARPGISTKRMLVSDGLAAANGQVFAFAHRGGLAVKLPAARIDELESAGRATRMSTGARTMREWAHLDPGDDWTALADEAHAFVAALPAKPPKAAKAPRKRS
jgi:TfoX/Sxy family transcriptional regulator of competence genes